MIVTKPDPVGIDSVIDRIQKTIHSGLLSKWKSISIYGMAEQVLRKKNTTLEVFEGKKGYHPITYSEGNKIFFVEGRKPILNSGQASNDLWLVCVLDINKIYDTGFRETERVHLDLMTELYKAVDLRNVIGLEYGMVNLKNIIEGVSNFGTFNYSDIHPYHIFMVKMNVKYATVINKC